MSRRRYLLDLVSNEKYREQLFNYVFYNLIPDTISGKTVKDKGKTKCVSIIGNGVVENQLVQNGNFEDTSVWQLYNVSGTTFSVADNVGIISIGTIVSGTSQWFQRITPINGHNYLLIFKIKTNANRDICLRLGGLSLLVSSTTSWKTVSNIATRTDSADDFGIFLNNANGGTLQNGDTIYIKDFMYIDLTLMYGTGNEPTTLTDNRIVALLNRGYIPYNVGTYKESVVQEIELEPYNLFDGTTSSTNHYLHNDGTTSGDSDCNISDYIKVIGGYTYTLDNIQYSNPSLCWYDENKNYISGEKYMGATTKDFVAPNNACYCRFTIVKAKADITCLHLTGTRTGYAPHINSSKITLPQPLSLGGAINSHNTFTITPTSYVFTRNVWKVDLSSLSFTQVGSTWNTSLTIAKSTTSNTSLPNAICTNLMRDTTNNVLSGTTNKTFAFSTGSTTMRVYDSSITQSSDIVGELYFELASPQTITIPKKHLGCVDLGSLSWTYQSGNARFYATVSDIKEITNDDIPNAICGLYTTIKYSQNSSSLQKTLFVLSSGTTHRVYIRDNTYTDTTTFKNAMAGIYLWYETTNEVADFTNKAIFERGGTINTNEYSWIENQMANYTHGRSISNAGITITNNNNGSFTIFGQATAYTDMWIILDDTQKMYASHKYLIFSGITGGSNSAGTDKMGIRSDAHTSTNMDIGYGSIGSPSSDTNRVIVIFTCANGFNMGTTGQTIKPQIVDLTLGFGAGNEPTSVDDWRIQDIINKGYIATNTTGTQAEQITRVLCDLNMKIQVK